MEKYFFMREEDMYNVIGGGSACVDIPGVNSPINNEPSTEHKFLREHPEKTPFFVIGHIIGGMFGSSGC